MSEKTFPESMRSGFVSDPPFVPPFLAVPRQPLLDIIGGYLLAIFGSLLLSAIVQPSPIRPIEGRAP